MSVKDLVDFIVRAENGGRLNWDSIYAGTKPYLRPDVPISHMTVQGVLDWQRRVTGYTKSTAVGGPQFIRKTLQDLLDHGATNRLDTFDEITQRNLAIALMRNRGLDQFLTGTMSAEDFANELAKEWASLPMVSGPRKGASYYGGDGLNKSQVTVTAFMDAVWSCRGSAPALSPVHPDPAPTSLWQRVLALLGV